MPSLAPYGKVHTISAKRLEYPFRGSWRERLITRLWEKRNASPELLCLLTHECTPECAETVMLNPLATPHKYLLPSDESVRDISSAMQWLGTHVGFSFIETYVNLVKELEKVPIEEREKAFEVAIKKFVF